MWGRICICGTTAPYCNCWAQPGATKTVTDSNLNWSGPGHVSATRVFMVALRVAPGQQ